MEKTPKESSSMRLCSIEVQVKVTKSVTKSVTNFEPLDEISANFLELPRVGEKSFRLESSLWLTGQAFCSCELVAIVSTKFFWRVWTR